MNLKKSTLIQLLMIILLLVSSYKNHDENAQEELCLKIKSKGLKQLVCKVWNDKAVTISKTRYGNTKTELFIEIFTNNNINQSTVEAYDIIENCPVDFFINYLEESLEITDLDNDGSKEISLVYEKTCRGGVNPADMIVVMIEGSEIYTLKGKRILSISNQKITDNIDKSTYMSSSNFIKAPKIFLEHSKELWNTNVLEK